MENKSFFFLHQTAQKINISGCLHFIVIFAYGFAYVNDK